MPSQAVTMRARTRRKAVSRPASNVRVWRVSVHAPEGSGSLEAKGESEGNAFPRPNSNYLFLGDYVDRGMACTGSSAAASRSRGMCAR